MGANDLRVPADFASRKLLADGASQSFFVNAAAGSGKTTALIDRIVRQLESGVEPSRIVAITFTTAAAAEMRDRLRSRLGALVASNEWAANALRSFDALTISTIHAYLLRLLTLHSIEVGLPPRVQLLADDSEAQEIDRLVREVRAALYDDPGVEVLVRRAFALGFADLRVPKMVLDLADLWHVLPLDSTPALELRPIGFALLVRLARAFVEFDSSGVPDSDAAVKLQNSMRPWFAIAASADSDESQCRQIASLIAVLKAKGTPKSKAWGADRKQEIQAALDHLRDAAEQTADDVRGEVEAGLVSCIGAVLVEGANRRLAQGQLTRHDLLVHGAHLVTTRPEMAREIASGIGSLFIDEFQDTDPLQAEFVEALNGAGTNMLVFTVGDPMQSIYRFRGADVYAFDQARHILAHEQVRLGVNFRSSPSIISMVNWVVPALISEAMRPLFDELVAHRSGAESRVTHLDGLHATVDGARIVEAEQIANVIQEMRADGSLASYSDAAILLPRRTGLPYLLEALGVRGIPVRIESRELLHETPEVINLMTVLGAISQPNDAVHVVGALRTSMIGCSDAELARYRRGGGSWVIPALGAEAVLDDAVPADPVHDALCWLGEMHRLQFTVDAPTVVKRVLTDTRAEELAFVCARPRDVLRRLDFLLDQARAYCDSGGASLAGFLRGMASQADANMTQNDRVVPEFDDDAVRFMTVHAAKGLEFPTVIVAGFADTKSAHQPMAIIDPLSDSGVVTQFAGPTSRFSELADRNKALEFEESVRLLYVALTRAQDHLVISTHRPSKISKENESIASRVVKALADSDPSIAQRWTQPVALAAGARSDRSPGEPPVARQFHSDDTAPWAEQRTAAIARQSAPTSVSASSLSHSEGDADADLVAPKLPTRRRGGTNGTEVGRAVHSVMQVVDLAGFRRDQSLAKAQIGAASRAHAEAEGVPDRAADVARIVTNCLASTVLIEAAKSITVHREVFVAATISAKVVEGFIDLLYQDAAGRWVLVDYKTDAITSAAQRDDRMVKYRLQGATYALLLQRAAGITVHQCVFVFADAPVALREIQLVDLESAVTEVVGRLSSGTDVVNGVG